MLAQVQDRWSQWRITVRQCLRPLMTATFHPKILHKTPKGSLDSLCPALSEQMLLIHTHTRLCFNSPCQTSSPSLAGAMAGTLPSLAPDCLQGGTTSLSMMKVKVLRSDLWLLPPGDPGSAIRCELASTQLVAVRFPLTCKYTAVAQWCRLALEPIQSHNHLQLQDLILNSFSSSLHPSTSNALLNTVLRWYFVHPLTAHYSEAPSPSSMIIFPRLL